jgi:N-acetylmuramoyl-L-alanine amidase
MVKITSNSLFFLPVLIFSLSALSAETPDSPPAAMAKSAPLSIRAFSLDQTLDALNSAAVENRAEFHWDSFFRGGIFSLGEHQGAFTAAAMAGETGFFMMDSKEIFSVALPWLDQGELFFPESFVQAAANAFSRYFEDDASRFRIAAIIIDPGHGGKDSGAVGTLTLNGRTVKVVEKEITLNVSKQLKTLLAGEYPDKRVLMTREGDSYPSLEARTVIANSVPLKENEAIIYISIHANASLNKHVRGYEVWYLSPDYRRNVIDQSRYSDNAEVIPILNAMLEEEFTKESVIIAQSILKAFGETMGKSMPSRGIKAEEWFVVRNSRMPAVLVELGFVSNREDALLLTNETDLRKMTEAVYKGITGFVGVFERSGGFIAAQ